MQKTAPLTLYYNVPPPHRHLPWQAAPDRWQRGGNVGDKHPLPAVGTHQKYTPCNWGLLIREWQWGARKHTLNETGYFAHSLYTVSFSTCCAFGAGDNGCEIMELALAPCSQVRFLLPFFYNRVTLHFLPWIFCVSCKPAGPHLRFMGSISLLCLLYFCSAVCIPLWVWSRNRLEGSVTCTVLPWWCSNRNREEDKH